jgi:hypothetical protein
MYFKLLAFILSLVMCTVTFAADKNIGDQITQLDFASKLIERFGWSEGLPEKPTEKDYLAILNGSRTYRFEAEDIYDLQTDSVTVRMFNLFGPFTGRGWIHGTSVPTAVHFTVFIPLAGKYTVTASTKGEGQLWSIAGRAFKISEANKLKEVVVGKVPVPSGKLEFNAVIPANGGLDYIIFNAPSLAPLEPVSGWNFSAPLTMGQLAEFRAALLGNEYLLPDDKSFTVKSISPASLSSLPKGVQITDKKMFGKSLSQKWVRSGLSPVTVDIPFDVNPAGVYRIRARFSGKVLNAGFGLRTVAVEGKPYLDWVDLGTFRLPKGAQKLQLHLPSSSGVDLVEISRKVSTVSDYFALAGLAGSPEDKVLGSELDAVIKSLQESFKERR